MVRQLPKEAEMFSGVDKSWKEIMCKVSKIPLAIEAGTQPGLLETFQNNNIVLEKIMKCLEAYLESKCDAFPRMYCLSNEELLIILSQIKNPDAVQPYLRNCFDAINKLEYKDNEIIGIISSEGEKVSFDKNIIPDGNVEEYLSKVEEEMILSLKKLMKSSFEDFKNCKREEWLTKWQSQIILTVSQTMWCKNITNILDGNFNRIEALKEFEKKSLNDLNSLAKLVLKEVPELFRLAIASLIVIDVHAKDVVKNMINDQVDDKSKFEWLSQLRYYWDNETDNSIVRISNSMHVYGYEYLGASPRLVITPLSERCHISLMNALELNLGK